MQLRMWTGEGIHRERRRAESTRWLDKPVKATSVDVALPAVIEFHGSDRDLADRVQFNALKERP